MQGFDEGKIRMVRPVEIGSITGEILRTVLQ